MAVPGMVIDRMTDILDLKSEDLKSEDQKEDHREIGTRTVNGEGQERGGRREIDVRSRKREEVREKDDIPRENVAHREMIRESGERRVQEMTGPIDDPVKRVLAWNVIVEEGL